MPQQPPAWQQHQQQHQQHQQHQPRFPQSQQQGPQYQQSNPWSSWKRTPHHQQPNPWSSWERPPPQQRRGRAPHQRRSQHRGGDQSHQQRAMCQQCGEDEHFPADYVITMPAPMPRHHPYAASSSGAHVAQYGTYPPLPWTSHDSDTHSTTSSYGSAPPHDNYTPAPPMPRPPRSVGSIPPPPPAPPLDFDWSFSSGPSQALHAHYVPPGEFPSSDWNDRRTEGGSAGGSYLPSAFVGQPVGIDQVNDVWIGDSGATTHMTRNTDLMYDTRPPSPHRSRILLGDGSIRKVQFVGKLDLVFHSRTDHPVTLHDVSFVPGLGFSLFSFHVVQEKREIILNKTGATCWVVVSYFLIGVMGHPSVLPEYCREETRARLPREQHLQTPLPTVPTDPLPCTVR